MKPITSQSRKCAEVEQLNIRYKDDNNYKTLLVKWGDLLGNPLGYAL